MENNVYIQSQGGNYNIQFLAKEEGGKKKFKIFWSEIDLCCVKARKPIKDIKFKNIFLERTQEAMH